MYYSYFSAKANDGRNYLYKGSMIYGENIYTALEIKNYIQNKININITIMEEPDCSGYISEEPEIERDYYYDMLYYQLDYINNYKQMIDYKQMLKHYEKLEEYEKCQKIINVFS